MLHLARVLHIVVGVFWAGTMFFNAWLLGPAIRDTGPEGGKVMGALARRGMLMVLPVAGILTILSGSWLYWYASAGFDSAYMGSRPGMVYGVGMIVTIIAFAIGILVVRPSIAKAATAEPAAAQQYRTRAAAAGKVVAWLMVVVVVTMAVGRYV